MNQAAGRNAGTGGKTKNAARTAEKEYDFALFDVRPSESGAAAAASKRSTHSKSPRKEKLPLFAIGIFILTALLLTIVIANYARLNEATFEVSRMKKEIERLENESLVLDIQIEKDLNLKNVEEYALRELGMSRLGKNQVVCVDITEGSPVQIMAFTQEKNSGVGQLLSSIMRSFNVIWEYLK